VGVDAPKTKNSLYTNLSTYAVDPFHWKSVGLVGKHRLLQRLFQSHWELRMIAQSGALKSMRLARGLWPHAAGAEDYANLSRCLLGSSRLRSRSDRNYSVQPEAPPAMFHASCHGDDPSAKVRWSGTHKGPP